MAASYADDARLLEIYPDLSAVDASLRAVWLEIAQGLVFAETFGDTLDVAHAAMTGHLLTRPKSGGGSGKAQSKSLGPASVTYAVKPPTSELEETGYGQDFLLILRSRCATVVGAA